ncbi:hypothetical protein ACFFX0_24020 [Citricoccus parietis]|uniref:Uncharacterized protein n=1 Tax=Citricoccus parietis TaxID=592307 RepID=A0ABV5G582_9MICC
MWKPARSNSYIAGASASQDADVRIPASLNAATTPAMPLSIRTTEPPARVTCSAG